MPTKSDLIKNLDWTTERMSNRVWAVSAGVLATSLTFIIESTRADGAPFLQPRQAVLPAVAALVAMGADLAQYYAASRQDMRLLDRMQRDKLETVSYDSRDPFYRLRMGAYFAKIAACLLAVLLIVGLAGGRVAHLALGGSG